jgi:hypothetical protein
VPGPDDRVRADRRVVLLEHGRARTRFGEPTSASRTAPGSMPRSGSRSLTTSGAPGAGATRRWVGAAATRS